MTTSVPTFRGHPPFPPCISHAAPYVPLVVATATSSPLPTLAREDRQRLTLFFKHGEDFALLADKLAEQLNTAEPSSPSDPSSPRPRVSACVSPPQHSALSPQRSALDEFSLQTWASQPDIAAHIACRRAEADYRARKNAITFLEEVLRSTDNLIEKRRAATAILRILSRAGAPPIRPSGTPTNSPPRATPPRATDRGPQVNGRSVSTTNHEPLSGTTSSQSHGSHESHRSHRFHSSPNEPPSTQSSALSPQSSNTGLRTQDSGPSPSPVHLLTCSPVPDSALSTQHSAPLTIPQAFTPKPGDVSGPQTPLPDPTRTDDQLLDLVLSSLKDLNTSNRPTALLALFNLSGRLNPRTPQAFKKFTYDIRRWLGWADPAQGWTYTSCTPLSRENLPSGLAARYTLTLPDASTTILSIFIRHESFGTLANCSLLASVLAIRPGATRADPIPPDSS
jgi:hypothetical protein